MATPGRPLADPQVERIRRLFYGDRWPRYRIARALGVSVPTVYRYTKLVRIQVDKFS